MIGNAYYEGFNVENIDRDIVFQFGDAFRMRVKEFIGMILGTSMIYRSLDFNGAVAIILSSLSGVLCALLLFLFDLRRCQAHDLSGLWALIPVAFICHFLFETVGFGFGITWWRVVFPVTW